jgi:hypothetical protein
VADRKWRRVVGLRVRLISVEGMYLDRDGNQIKSMSRSSAEQVAATRGKRQRQQLQEYPEAGGEGGKEEERQRKGGREGDRLFSRS